MKQILLLSLIVATTQANFQTTVIDSPWVDEKGDITTQTPARTIQVKNSTPYPLTLTGFRFTTPNAPATLLKKETETKLLSVTSIDSVETGKTWLATLDPAAAETNILISSLPREYAFTAMGASGKEWTPTSIQCLYNNKKVSHQGLKMAPPITIEDLQSLITTPSFYNEELYVADTIGIRGSSITGGYTDSWVDQESGTPFTQVQLNLFAPDTYATVNGLPVTFQPGLMGTHQSPDGKGPMYAMSMIMIQELLGYDMQLLLACAANESLAGLEVFQATGAGKVSQGIYYGYQGGSLEGNTGKNGSEQLGTMHSIVTSFQAYSYNAFRPLFPYMSVGQPTKIFKTPLLKDKGDNNLGYCAGNSAQQVNTQLTNMAYCIYWTEFVKNASDWSFETIMATAKDRKIGAKLLITAWNRGFQGLVPELLKDGATLEKTDITSDCGAYAERVFSFANKLEEASKNSVNNGGQCLIYDDQISKEKLAEFFFGLNHDADGNVLGTSLELTTTGFLGQGGLLQHVELTYSERIALWQDVNAAFDLLKGKAPSTKKSENISVRYDFLSVLRIAKKHFSLPLYLPHTKEFPQLVAQYSHENPKYPNKIFPFMTYHIQQDTMYVSGSTDPTLSAYDSLSLQYRGLKESAPWISAIPINSDPRNPHFALPLREIEGEEVELILNNTYGGHLNERVQYTLEDISTLTTVDKAMSRPMVRLVNGTLQLSEISAKSTVSVFDVRGRLLKSVRLSPTKLTTTEGVSLKELSSGSYIVRIATDDLTQQSLKLRIP